MDEITALEELADEMGLDVKVAYANVGHGWQLYLEFEGEDGNTFFLLGSNFEQAFTALSLLKAACS